MHLFWVVAPAGQEYPALQTEQLGAPALLNVPPAHVDADDAPAGQKEPAGHFF